MMRGLELMVRKKKLLYTLWWNGSWSCKQCSSFQFHWFFFYLNALKMWLLYICSSRKSRAQIRSQNHLNGILTPNSKISSDLCWTFFWFFLELFSRCTFFGFFHFEKKNAEFTLPFSPGIFACIRVYAQGIIA